MEERYERMSSRYDAVNVDELKDRVRATMRKLFVHLPSAHFFSNHTIATNPATGAAPVPQMRRARKSPAAVRHGVERGIVVALESEFIRRVVHLLLPIFIPRR